MLNLIFFYIFASNVNKKAMNEVNKLNSLKAILAEKGKIAKIRFEITE